MSRVRMREHGCESGSGAIDGALAYVHFGQSDVTAGLVSIGTEIARRGLVELNRSIAVRDSIIVAPKVSKCVGRIVVQLCSRELQVTTLRSPRVRILDGLTRAVHQPHDIACVSELRLCASLQRHESRADVRRVGERLSRLSKADGFSVGARPVRDQTLRCTAKSAQRVVPDHLTVCPCRTSLLYCGSVLSQVKARVREQGARLSRHQIEISRLWRMLVTSQQSVDTVACSNQLREHRL